MRPPRSWCSSGLALQYGKQEKQPVAEDAAAAPLCLHAVHKHTVEEYLHLYGRLFGIRYTIARLTNPYGPGQLRGRTAYGIINRLIQLALADEPLSVYGNGIAEARLHSRGRCGHGAPQTWRV